MTLWAKGEAHEPTIARFEAARNAALDAELARYDVLGSLAHARMLLRVGLLSHDDWQALDVALRAMLSEAQAGALQPTPADEDIHTLVERLLVERVGDAGKRLHTGRSRNDQALVDLRLYAKDALLRLAEQTLATAQIFASFARAHEWAPMPGYTHMQRAMLSSVGLWASGYAEALLDDLIALHAAFALNDQSPLGSAAAYGVPLPLDRAYVAESLGFGSLHHNSLTAANARGKTESAIIQALSLIMLDLSKWAQDVLIFTTSEFGFFSVPVELCDGSSIMPQKHNLSALELVRARAHTVIGLQAQALQMLVGLPSGYNMDYQETKRPLMEAIALTEGSLEVIGLFAAALRPQQERLRLACAAELFATDRAYELAAQGMPFRDAYRVVAADPASQEPGDLTARLRARTHAGTTGALDLDGLDVRIAARQEDWRTREQAFAAALRALASGELAPPDAAITHSSGLSASGTAAFMHEIAPGI